MGAKVTLPDFSSNIVKMEAPDPILDDWAKPCHVQLPDDLVRLILMFEGGCVQAWQRDRIGRIYSNVYREFFGPQNGTTTLQKSSDRLLGYYCAFVTYILSRPQKECRFHRYGRFYPTVRRYRSRMYFKPWIKLVKKYKLQADIARVACHTEAPLISYFQAAQRRFGIRDLGTGMLFFGS